VIRTMGEIMNGMHDARADARTMVRHLDEACHGAEYARDSAREAILCGASGNVVDSLRVLATDLDAHIRILRASAVAYQHRLAWLRWHRRRLTGRP